MADKDCIKGERNRYLGGRDRYMGEITRGRWCLESDSNRHGCNPLVPKTSVSTNFTIQARPMFYHNLILRVNHGR